MTDMNLNILVSAKNTAGSIFGNLANAFGNLSFGLRNVGTEGTLASDALGAAGKNAGAALAGIGIAATLAGIAVAGYIGVQAVKAAADFQTGLTVLSTGAGELKSNLQMVGDGIKQISIDTATSTDQLLKGMFMIESGGYRAKDALNVLRVAAMGARLENTDLGAVAFSLTGLLHDYGMASTDAAAAMNALIVTESSGKMKMQDLTTSLGNVLPLAATLKVAYPQIGAAIAVMTNANMTARRATQNLNFELRALSAPSATAVKAMQSVGLSAQQVKDTLAQQGLTGAIQLITNAVGRTFPAGSVAAVTALKAINGGATGLNVALMLSGTHMKEFQTDVTNITAAMNNGKAGVMGWSQVQDTFNFKLGQLHDAVNVLLIDLGTSLLPILTRVVGALTYVVRGVIDWLTNSRGLPDLINTIGGALSPIAGLFQQVGQAISFVLSPVQQIATAFATTTQVTTPLLDTFSRATGIFQATTQAANPMFDAFNRAKSVLSGIPAIAKPAIDAFTLKPTAKVTPPSQLQDTFDRTKGVFSGPAAAPLLDTFDRAKSVIPATTQAAKPFLDTFNRAKSVVAGFAPVAGPMLDSFDRAKSVLVTTTQAGNPFVSIFHAIGDVMQNIGTFLSTTFAPVWQQLATTWNSQILPALKNLWTALQPLVLFIGGVLVTALIVGLGLLVGFLTGIAKGLAGFLSGVITMIGGIAQVINGVVQVFSGIVQFIVDLFTGNFSKLGSDLGVIWQGIQNIFQGALNVIVGFFQTVVGTIWGLISGMVQGIVGFFTTLWNDLVGHSIIPDMINGIIGWFMMLPTAIGNAFSGLGTLVHSIWDGITLGVKGGINAIISVINGFIGFIDSIQIHIPSIGVGPFQTPAFNWNGLGIPQIPYLATGGYVQASGLAMIHRGESVIPARVASLGGGGGEVHHHYNITINALSRDHTPQELATKVLDEISRKLNRSGGLVTTTSGGRAS